MLLMFLENDFWTQYRKLKAITASQPEIEIISRYEKSRKMDEYPMTTKVLGSGLSLVLLLIGIMNFINTMIVSVTGTGSFALLDAILKQSVPYAAFTYPLTQLFLTAGVVFCAVG